jgi:hypothetical protein
MNPDRSDIFGYIERSQKRGYATFFEWPLDRDLAELGVVRYLVASMEADHQSFFHDIKSRGRGNDPPDCEAFDNNGQRTAIEVTELVDPRGIVNFQSGRTDDWVVWTQEKFLEGIGERLFTKAKRSKALKDGPYPGGYSVVIFTDEPALSMEAVSRYLINHKFPAFEGLSMAFLLLGYDPAIQACPWFRLGLGNPNEL